MAYAYPYYPQYPVTPPAPSPQGNGLIWVQGEAGAKSYLVAPNSTVTLWDSESQSIYLKSADAAGMPSIKVLDYTIRPDARGSLVANPALQPSSVSRDELEALRRQVDELRERIMKDEPVIRTDAAGKQ